MSNWRIWSKVSKDSETDLEDNSETVLNMSNEDPARPGLEKGDTNKFPSEKEKKPRKKFPKGKLKKEDNDFKLESLTPPSTPSGVKRPKSWPSVETQESTATLVRTDSNANSAVVNYRVKRHQVKGNKTQKLHLAALSGNEVDVKKLLNKGVDVNLPDSFGKTPLHNAILGNQMSVVEMLLKAGADVKATDERGDTPLHTAVRVGNEEIVATLLKNGRCNANEKGHISYSPLHIAAQMDNVNICKLLVQHEAHVDYRGEDGMTPLGQAVSKGAQSVVDFFFTVANETHLNMDNLLYNVDSEGSTLLHLAVDSGIVTIVGLCLKNGAQVRQAKESDQSTAFHLACTQGSLEIVQLLANSDPDVCKNIIIDDQGMTPLHRAAINNHVAIAEFLLDQGAVVNTCDMCRRTPLYLAASVGGTETVQLLMDKGADVTRKDVELRSPLHAATGHVKTMEVMLKNPLSRNLITDKDVTGFTPVHYAAREGHLKIINLFLCKNKAASTVTSDTLETPLHLAAKHGWVEIAEKLLEKRNVRMINHQDDKDRTPLHYACGEGHDTIAELLLMEGATIDRDQDERTQFHMAALNGSERCVQSILQTHPDCLNLMDKYQNTALNLAAIAGHAPIVSYLLSVKDQEILMNSYNQNVLDLAVEATKEDVAMAIAEHDRWKEVIHSSAVSGPSQLEILVEKMPDVAERFLDRCVEREGDVTSKDYKVTYDLTFVQGKFGSVQTLETSLAALRTMAMRRRESCLTHPVCYMLMSIKWKKFGWITFSINVLIYLAFLIPLTYLAIYVKQHEDKACFYNSSLLKEKHDYHPTPRVLQSQINIVYVTSWAVIIFASIHLFKECIQLYRMRVKYFTEVSNYLEWTIYVTALIYVIPPDLCKNHFKPEVVSFSLFFGWLNLVLYFRRLSFHGKYVIMLFTMFKTLLQVGILFLLFIIAFGTTFYILMEKYPAYHSFQESMMKVFIMTLGELNYEPIFIDRDMHYPTSMNILFVLFCLGMPIILMNMLIGLAVGDIDKIQQNAVMERYVMQVELLLEIEESLPQWILRRMQVDRFEEFPNKSLSFSTKFYEKAVGFGNPNRGEDAERTLPPHLSQMKEKIDEQEEKIKEIHILLTKQYQMLKVLTRREGFSEGSNEGGSRKGLMNWFFKKGSS